MRDLISAILNKSYLKVHSKRAESLGSVGLLGYP